jgi:hypothetical protein
MARAIWQKTVTNNTGAPSNGAQVTVNIQDGGLATIFSFQEGGSARSNPFTTGIDGIARFYAERGYYTVTVFKDNSSVSFPWNNLGDKNLFDDLGTAAFKNVNNMGDIGTGAITATAGALVNGSVRFRDAGVIDGVRQNVGVGGTMDLSSVNEGGGGYQGFLSVSNGLTASAGIRTQSTFSVMGRGSSATFTQIATLNNGGGASFTLSIAGNGVIRMTNTTTNNCTMAMQFFGGASL